MSTQVQYRRGTGSQNNAFTGALGEITVDTTNWTLRVHDGVTAGGGGNLATVAYVDAEIGGLSADSISNGTSNVKVISSGGNVNITVGGSIVQTVASTGTFITGLVSATGNVQGGNLTTAGLISATGNVTSGNLSTTLVTATTLSATGNVTGGNILTAGLLSATGSITTAGDISITGNIVDGAALTVTTSSNGNITFDPNGSGVVVFNKDLRNGQANGVGNIGTTGGFFNTVFAKATSAQYADVAEKYVADQAYTTGTVLEIGGSAEVRATTAYATTGIAGVVSSHPALIMNSGESSENAIEVALLGRVPCRVTGTIHRGDLLVASAIAGVATALDPTQYQPGSVIGKALADYDGTTEGMIEVLVGRL